VNAFILESAQIRLSIKRENILPNFIAASSVGIPSLPDRMAFALLSGINPLVINRDIWMTLAIPAWVMIINVETMILKLWLLS
jgi:hypothetical protein